jgi:hypothetical protein
VNGHQVHNSDTVRLLGPPAPPIAAEVALELPRPTWSSNRGLRLVAERARFLELGLERGEARLTVRRRGARLRLASPTLGVSRPVWGGPGPNARGADTLVLRAVVGPWRMSLAAQSVGAYDAPDVQLHPIAGWSLLASIPRSNGLGHLLTALWTGALIFPLAYWSAAAGAHRRRLTLAAAMVVALVVMWTVGSVAGAAAPPWPAAAAVIVVSLAAFRFERALRATIARDR